MFNIAVICGGPSPERGISLNSARSIMDHLHSKSIAIKPLYVDYQKNFHAILPAHLYSNTPADFDFKLQKMGMQLDDASLKKFFKGIDLAFPVIHGPYGEDGELQGLLEKLNIPYVGPSSVCCKKMYPKHQAAKILSQNGFATLPMLVLSKNDPEKLKALEGFFETHKLTRAILKPSCGGSSIGVSSVSSARVAFEKAEKLFSSGLHTHVIVEPFCKGVEFTVVVLQNREQRPVALMPTEIEISYDNDQIFDYRKKYLPTNSTSYHTPPHFETATTKMICEQAEKLFALFEMRDFVRIDGWVTDDNHIYFTDFNPISGLEQNSFFFRQAAVVGLNHRQATRYLVENACLRYGLKLPCDKLQDASEKKKVHVLFGGMNAERQVSLMSGTNVWLKLLKSERFFPVPMLYDGQGGVWKLPYSYTLNHTVEEVYQNCLSTRHEKDVFKSLSFCVQSRLGIQQQIEPHAERMSLNEFFLNSKADNAFVFIAMHGGFGEDGTLQNHLESHQLAFNGSKSKTSSLCMDKWLTGQVIEKAHHPDILALPKWVFSPAEAAGWTLEAYRNLWNSVCETLQTEKLIIKPRNDGCSAGIVSLASAEDFMRYCRFIENQAKTLPSGSFTNQTVQVEMPSDLAGQYILEPYIETDQIAIQKHELVHKVKKGWIELTVGVIEENQNYRALSPSITIAEGSVLSLEEKFQGGTGINITPPPETIIKNKQVEKIRRLIEITAKLLEIQNYARIDIFYNTLSEKIIVIEANSLPGLTPSTVIYHQALAESIPMPPLKFLEHLITTAEK